jgi:large subunit ribosomal protein L18
MTKLKRQKRIARKRRIRAVVKGSAKRPRLTVFRSNKHIHLQLIDDESGKTVASASTATVKAKTAADKIKLTAAELAAGAKKQGIEVAVFDRSGYKYHGQVKAAAEAVREAGLKI